MAKTSSPYGLSLHNTVDSNYSGTLLTVPIASGTIGNIFCGDPVTAVLKGDYYTNATTYNAAHTTITAASANGQLFTYNNAEPPVLTGTSRQLLGVFNGVVYTNMQGQKIRQTYWADSTPTFQANGIGPNNQTMSIDALATINPAKGATYKIQCFQNIFTGIPGQIFNTISDVADYFMYNWFNFAVPGNVFPSNAANNSTVPYNGQSKYALDATTKGAASGLMQVIGVCPTATSNIGAQWMDPYPDLLVKLSNTIAPNF